MYLSFCLKQKLFIFMCFLFFLLENTENSKREEENLHHNVKLGKTAQCLC